MTPINTRSWASVWQPLKLYYNIGFNKARVTAMHEGMLAEGLESPYAEWLEKWEDREDRADRTTTRVPCGDYFEVRDDALRAHATQVDPEGFWFKVPLAVQRKIWPTEDFELVRSLVGEMRCGRRSVRGRPRVGLRLTPDVPGRASRVTAGSPRRRFS